MKSIGHTIKHDKIFLIKGEWMMMDRGNLAKEYFMQGYNCAQSVLLAFSDVTGLDEDFAAKMASSFGGGIGRLREVCGAVSSMMTVFGIVYGYADPKAKEDKTLHYERVQELARRFREANGSIICRELLSESAENQTVKTDSDREQISAMLSNAPVPTERTEAYYQKRPCAELCAIAANIVDAYMKELGVVS